MNPLPDNAEEYLASLRSERGLAANTLAAYRRDLGQYFDAVGAAPPDPASVSGFVAELHERGLAPATVARKIAAVRGYHRFLVAEGMAADDPTVLLASPRRGAPLPKALSIEEVQRLLDVPDRTTPLGSRDAALLEFLYATGCRVGEVVGVDVLDVDLEEGSALVTGKGAKQRIVPLGRYAIDAVVGYLPIRMELRAGRRDPGRLFLNARGAPLTRQGVWQIVRSAGRRAGLAEDRVSPHVLRHSAATHMVEGGADLRSVQEILGHASISTTQVYTRVAPRHLYEVYVSSHPRSR